MRSKYSSTITTILALVILFSLPALACSILTTNPPGQSIDNQETKMAADIKASLTANAETQAAQITITPPPSPTLPLPPEPTDTTGPTHTPVPTRTPAPTRSPTPSGPWVGEIIFASEVDQDYQPINPGIVFKKGITRIYGVFPFSGFEMGMKITLYWTVNGKEFISYVRTWEWDPSGSFPASTFYTNNRQLDSGNWMLTIFVENKKLTSGTFKILP